MFVKSVMLRFVAAVMATFMLSFTGISIGGEYDVKDPETCTLNFSVLSDSHIEGNNFTRYKVFARSVQNVKKNGSGNDAIVFLGDNTMNGNTGESLLFHGAVAALLQGEKVLTVMGNHDIGNGQGDYEELNERWFEYTNTFFDRDLRHTYYYDVIDGFYFIVLGPEAQRVNDVCISNAQFCWLEAVLAEAAESGKPTFLFMHHPTVSVVDEELQYTRRLTNLLAEYNREHDLFCFVGHTHMPMHLSQSFRTYNGYPETYLACLTKLSGEKDNEILPETGVGAEIEVYAGEVVIRARNFYAGEWQTEEDGELCEVTYTLKNAVS